MQIILKSLTLTNFKGIRSLNVKFSSVTNAYGANQAGKTTLFDAFLWLLFEKDSTDRKDFEVKTLDENNQPYHKLDHEVVGVFLIDGEETILRKSLREKWTKPRGQKDEVFAGHETTYYWNDVPMKKNEFQARIDALVNETTFRMITNPLFFNNMKWQDRRQMLIKMAGPIDETEIYAGCGASAELIEMLRKKTPDEIKKETAAKISKIKEQKDLIPARIEEAERSVPAQEEQPAEQYNYDELEAELKKLEADLQTVEDLLMNQTKAEQDYSDSIKKLMGEKNALNQQISDIHFNEQQKVKQAEQARRNRINELQMEMSGLENESNQISRVINNLKADLHSFKTQKDSLLAAYKVIQAETLVFSDDDSCCPTCKRAYEAADVEAKKAELTGNFNKKKAERTDANVKQGRELNQKIENATAELAKAEADLLAINQKIADKRVLATNLGAEHKRLSEEEVVKVAEALEFNPEHKAAKARIAEIDEQVNSPRSDNGKAIQLTRKQDLNSKINQVRAKLATKGEAEKIAAKVKELTDKANARIAELDEMNSKMAQELADLEGTQYALEQYTKAKMTMVEERVNSMFAIVKFKMFEEQINGGQAETCVALINGVPFADANNASKVNAGLDIINTLNNHLNIYAPIFIDNRESVTNIIPLKSQVVNLIVSPAHKKLTIEAEKLEMAV